MGVNIRFSVPDYERLKAIATYREVTVTALLHYVVIHSVLPRLEREVQLEQRQNRDQPEPDHQVPTQTRPDLDRPVADWSVLPASAGESQAGE
jgi:hypothetical protein